MTAPFVEPLREVVACLDRMAVPFFVAGSVASTMHGEIRTTQDVDLVAELGEPEVRPLVISLRDRYYVDEAGVLEAVRRRGSCNLIHLATAFKVDLFVRRERVTSAGRACRWQLPKTAC